MLIVLNHRHYGIHRPKKIQTIKTRFSSIVGGNERDDFTIDENKLIAALPKGFLPVEIRQVLITVGDKHGSTGISGLSRFHNWAKYFDAYVLELCKPGTKRQLPTLNDELRLSRLGIR